MEMGELFHKNLIQDWFANIGSHLEKFRSRLTNTWSKSFVSTKLCIGTLCADIILLSLSLCWPHHNQENGHIILRQSKSAVFAIKYHLDQNLCLILCGWHCVLWVSGKGRALSGSNIDLSLRWERIWIQHWSLGGSPLVSLEAALNFATIVHSFSHPHL